MDELQPYQPHISLERGVGRRERRGGEGKGGEEKRGEERGTEGREGERRGGEGRKEAGA